jgi:hypothetical protein
LNGGFKSRIAFSQSFANGWMSRDCKESAPSKGYAFFML